MFKNVLKFDIRLKLIIGLFLNDLRNQLSAQYRNLLLTYLFPFCHLYKYVIRKMIIDKTNCAKRIDFNDYLKLF